MVVAAALCLLTLLAWLFLLAGAGTGMDPFAMSGWLMPLQQPPALGSEWTPSIGSSRFCMWVGMMVAMMLPSASPMVLLYARVVRHAESQGPRLARAPPRSLPSPRPISACGFFSACWRSPLSGRLNGWARMSAMMSLRGNRALRERC